MKQGYADRSGPSGRKIEPRSEGINPGAVSRLGNKVGNHSTDNGKILNDYTPTSEGRGYHAPGIGAKSHKGGSQGSY
jgi:hypothetical protein